MYSKHKHWQLLIKKTLLNPTLQGPCGFLCPRQLWERTISHTHRINTFVTLERRLPNRFLSWPSLSVTSQLLTFKKPRLVFTWSADPPGGDASHSFTTKSISTLRKLLLAAFASGVLLKFNSFCPTCLDPNSQPSSAALVSSRLLLPHTCQPSRG